jgi:hypothetical protein
MATKRGPQNGAPSTRKKKPTDATLRNVRASRRRDDEIVKRLIRLEDLVRRIAALHLIHAKLEE